MRQSRSEFDPMIHAVAKFRIALPLAGVALAVVLATSGAQSAATRISPLVEPEPVFPLAEQMFSDAPDGVDPVVTGPVSTAFRTRQAQAGCDKAKWPNIPVSCYPD